MQIDAAVGFARNGAADHIANAKDFVTTALGLAQAGKGIQRLAGLSDHQQQGVAVEGRVAVAEFAGVLDFGRQVRQFFEQVFAHQAGMPARAAGGDDDAVHRPQFGGGHVQPAKARHGAVVVDAAPQRVAHRLRLLEDLLEHVMRKAALLGSFRREFKLADLDLGGAGADGLNLEAVGGEA